MKEMELTTAQRVKFRDAVGKICNVKNNNVAKATAELSAENDTKNLQLMKENELLKQQIAKLKQVECYVASSNFLLQSITACKWYLLLDF